MSLLRTKTVEQSLRDTEEPEHSLRKDLSALDLTVFGVGVIIGTGIFVLTGVAAATHAGPAIALSFVVAGVVCGLAALCYAEFASTVPVAGSAYTFSYASLGELIAWIIGWDLMLELALGGAVVSRGWSQYLVSLLDIFGLSLPASIAGADAVVDIPAVLIVLALTGVLILGIKLSSRVNMVVVTIKVTVVLFVILAGLFYVRASNYSPFIPPAQPAETTEVSATLWQVLTGLAPSTFGLWGIFAGASVVFFAYIGFDIVATAAEETRHPQRDLPIGILGSLFICTTLYVAVSLVVVGMQHYTRLNTGSPLSDAFKAVGLDWAATIIAIGALAGLTTVMMILMLGQSRVFFAMARDGLLPITLARVHPRFGTPARITAITGLAVALLAAVVPLAELAKLVNIGTLFAFVLVSLGVIMLRRSRPDLPRAFRMPAVPLLPILAALACLWLMLNLEIDTWIRFVIWLAIGFLVYFGYGRRNARLGLRVEQEVTGAIAQTAEEVAHDHPR
jgi:APA family basic amino acid/polyamine antiporter